MGLRLSLHLLGLILAPFEGWGPGEKAGLLGEQAVCRPWEAACLLEHEVAFFIFLLFTLNGVERRTGVP